MDLDLAYYQSLDLLRALVSIPSVSRDEAAVADCLAAYMAKASGQQVGRSGNNCWLIAPGFEPSRPTLLLNAHCDTVKPVASWQHDPFKPTEETVELPDGSTEQRIYGLGTNDDGASLVSLLHIYLILKDTPQAYNLIFLASCEEEVSGRGGIESVLPLLPRIDLALVGEPTGMHAAVAEKGLVVLDATAHGKSGHAARNEGVNAIYLALDAVQKIRDYEFARESATLGPIKKSVTVIQAGTVHNVVPDTCTFVVDVRTTDAYTNQQTVELLQQLVAPVELKPRSTRLQPSGIDESHPLVRRIALLGRRLFGSPTLSDQALLSCPSLKMGPGDSARSHTADEYIRPEEIREALHLYYSVLNGLTF